MMLKATAFNLTRDYRGEWLLHITLKSESVRNAMNLFDKQKPGKVYDVEVEQHRERRSLSANAYFHKLCNKLAAALGVSNDEMKVHLVRLYGTLAQIDGHEIEIRIPKGAKVEDYYPYTEWLRGDALADYYAAYKQTHALNGREFSRLIDGTVSECKALGIETLPPEELERMYAQADKSNGDSESR